MSWLDRYFVSRNYTSVQDSGTDMAPQPTLNFIGFAVENDANNNRTNVTNTGGGGATFIGYVEIAMADANHDVSDSEAENAIIECTGALTADKSLIFDQPSSAGASVHVIKNSTTGGFNISVEVSAGGGSNIILIGPGLSQLIEVRPTGIFNAVTGI